MNSVWLAKGALSSEICRELVPRNVYLGRSRFRYGVLGLVSRLKSSRVNGSVLMVVALSGMSSMVSRLTLMLSGVGSSNYAFLTLRGVSSRVRWAMAGIAILKLFWSAVGPL